MDEIKHAVGYALIAVMALGWLYIMARLVVWAGARSWFEAARKWNGNKKQERGE